MMTKNELFEELVRLSHGETNSGFPYTIRSQQEADLLSELLDDNKISYGGFRWEGPIIVTVSIR